MPCAPSSAFRRAWLPSVLASLVLTGCPQWLQDEFLTVTAGRGGQGSGAGTNGGSGGSTGAQGGSGTEGGTGSASQGGGGGSATTSTGGEGGAGGNAGSTPEAGSGGDESGGSGSAGGNGSVGGNAGSSGGDAGSSQGGSSGAGGTPTKPDAGAPPGPDLTVLRNAIVHRYDFEQAGTLVVDRVGSADGTFVGGMLDGTSGFASLSGNGQYVELPPGLISGYEAVTLEAWIVWTPYSALSGWERVFDFGTNDGAFGTQGDTAASYLFLTPNTGGLTGTTHLAFRGAVVGATTLNAADALEADTTQHLAAVVDGSNNEMAIYLNGAVLASRAVTNELSSVNDENNWLGRSQYADDDDFRGQILEFRIYDAALDAEALELSFMVGPDADL